jgi:hypothetical protein
MRYIPKCKDLALFRIAYSNMEFGIATLEMAVTNFVQTQKFFCYIPHRLDKVLLSDKDFNLGRYLKLEHQG